MPEQSDTRYCKRCGTVVADGARFCVQCGAPVEPAEPRTSPIPPGSPTKALPSSRIQRLAMVLGRCGAALAMSVAAWWLAGTASSLAKDGQWTFASNEDGIQAIYARSALGDGPALFRMACNTEDGVVWMNSQALASAEVERLARTRHRFDMTLGGAGKALALGGYVSHAPEGASISYETPATQALLSILAAADFTVAGPALSLRAGDARALADFARACPAVAGPAAGDRHGWGTSTSLASGYRLDIPRALFRITSGDRFGRTYASDTGNAALHVASQVNALELSLADALKAGQAGAPVLDSETYRHATRDSVVLSGLSRGSIVYFKARATCGNANLVSFTLTYDAGARETFDPIAARMAKSFDARTLPDGRPLCP